ncbi:hypothetical protein CCACVL1_12349 [Corchorus capsularis]|uniref:Uncharacterized protein n=1 Tax=Corchorus capsularis TaxID=210143 RepID=A0A1R3IGB6_COCAP|nr:hypothetical protein CCACVL1_12349 [Corchorus capsularis]
MGGLNQQNIQAATFIMQQQRSRFL